MTPKIGKSCDFSSRETYFDVDGSCSRSVIMTPKIVKRNHFAPLYWLLVARWMMQRRRHYDAKDRKFERF